jgi:hypothetical protein
MIFASTALDPGVDQGRGQMIEAGRRLARAPGRWTAFRIAPQPARTSTGEAARGPRPETKRLQGAPERGRGAFSRARRSHPETSSAVIFLFEWNIKGTIIPSESVEWESDHDGQETKCLAAKARRGLPVSGGATAATAHGTRPCENSTRYNRTRNFEACGHAQSKNMQKFLLRLALQPN